MFEKIKVNSLKYKTNDLPSVANKVCELPALTAGIQNQGLNNYVPKDNATILKNVISISANGANTGATFYQSKEFTVLQDAYAVKWIYSDIVLTENQYLFLVSAISKRIYGNYEWTNKAGWERIKHDTIPLPVSTTGEIDLAFMENFMNRIKQDRIQKLYTYLMENKLLNTELSEKEKAALSLFNNLKWQEYKLVDLFDINGTKSLDSNAIEFVNNGINFVGRTFENNGIQGKIEKQDFEPNKPFTITATVIGNYKYVKYQREPYYCSQNINKLTPKEIITRWNKYIAYYFVCNIQKFVSIYDGQQGGYKLNDIKNHRIYLPTISSSQIDFSVMETLIAAIQKCVIQDVVTYVNDKGSNNIICC